MTGANPIIEELGRMASDRERAEWLLTCPLYFFVSEYEALRVALLSSRFRAGLDYVNHERAGLMARRLPDGLLPQGPMLSVHMARLDLAIAVRRQKEDS
ncbi:MAG: hypothetical protein QHC90_25815 [Shinella sp.]|nr:hypothetical protein [Shinella sp.]